VGTYYFGQQVVPDYSYWKRFHRSRVHIQLLLPAHHGNLDCCDPEVGFEGIFH